MKNKNQIKLGKIKARETIFLVLFVFIIVSLSAFGLRLAEQNIINKAEAEAETIENLPVIDSISKKINSGYLTIGTVLGIKTSSEENYQAKLTAKAYPSVRIYPGRALTYWVEFKNTGTKTWFNTGENFIALNVADPAGRESSFQHEFWSEYYYRPGRLLNEEVRPGEVGRFQFALKAPLEPGNYTEKFALVAENREWIAGGEISIPIIVFDPNKPVEIQTLEKEPDIRIGLYDALEKITLRANGKYYIKDSDGNLLKTVNAETSSVEYIKGQYVH